VASAITLQIVQSRPPSAGGGCPAGSDKLPDAVAFPGSGQCYRKVSAPLTVSNATVTFLPRGAAVPGGYVARVVLPPAEGARLTSLSTTAFHSHEDIATIIAGKAWSVAEVLAPFGNGFEIPVDSLGQATELEHVLLPPR
jgi:hypothetical protein